MHTIDRSASSTLPSSARRELLCVVAGAILGLVLVPALVYFTGVTILGSYANGERGLFGFYANLGKDLAAGEVNSWLLILLPYIALRVFWQLVAPRLDPAPLTSEQPAVKQRKEPTL